MNLTSMAEPNFSMRYNEDTPDDLVRLAAKLIRTGCGMPSMFNDEVVVKGLDRYRYKKRRCLGHSNRVGNRSAGKIRA